MEIDRWNRRRGAKHDTYTKQVGETVLRTTISHGRSEYRSLAPAILKQLGVDEATFYDVLRSGEPAPRPCKVETIPQTSELPDWCLKQLSKYFSANELSQELNLTPEEAEHLVKVVYSAPTDLDRSAMRARVRERLHEFRT